MKFEMHQYVWMGNQRSPNESEGSLRDGDEIIVVVVCSMMWQLTAQNLKLDDLDATYHLLWDSPQMA